MIDDLPETILQFGAGNFLRAFADMFVHQANELGQKIGRIVVVQSTGDGRASLLNQQAGKYHVIVRGIENGRLIDRVETCASISRALVASDQWAEILALAQSPQLTFVLSNTTEAGYALDATDRALDRPPRSFPAKLTAVLHSRWAAEQPGVTLLPCELLEDNAEKLRGLVLQVSDAWNLPSAFRNWLQTDCVWLSSLVDRIVPGTPKEHPLLESDPLLLMAEPFAFWALQSQAGAARWADHSSIVRTDDVKPYFLRKVRILNGAHTALLCKVGLKQFETVGDALNDDATRSWIERLLFEEIVPTVDDRVDGAEQFARQTIERFRNPFLRHKLADIALHHATKRDVRLVPTFTEFQQKFGRVPPRLQEALQAPNPKP